MAYSQKAKTKKLGSQTETPSVIGSPEMENGILRIKNAKSGR